MPGAMGPGKPIEDRTKGELIGMFIVAPIVAGGCMLGWTILNAATHSADLSIKDWLWQAWLSVVGLVLLFGLPAVGWGELLKRKRKEDAPPAELASPPAKPG